MALGDREVVHHHRARQRDVLRRARACRVRSTTWKRRYVGPTGRDRRTASRRSAGRSWDGPSSASGVRRRSRSARSSPRSVVISVGSEGSYNARILPACETMAVCARFPPTAELGRLVVDHGLVQEPGRVVGADEAVAVARSAAVELDGVHHPVAEEPVVRRRVGRDRVRTVAQQRAAQLAAGCAP